MTGIARIPRRRGSLCGILLVLLGAWGALIPFVGPYFHYAYSPDRAWAYSSGRLYLSILPGIAALLGGLLVLATRSRPVGVLGGFIAAAGGAWLVVGYPVILEITKKTTINPGVPTGAGTSPAVIPMTPILPVQSARAAREALAASSAVNAGPLRARACRMAARIQRIHDLPL